MAIGNVAGSNGTVLVTGAGSTIDSKSFLNVGIQGIGALTVENGGKVLATQGRFGTPAATGTRR